MSESADNASCTGPGCGIGSIAAFALSWHTWHSLGWALVHFCCGWFYVVYWILRNL